MEISGATAWPFAIGGQMSERWEWMTDPMEPPYGPPQNRKLRQAPRIFLNYDGLETRDNRRWMETLLNANGAGLWHVPLVIDDAELATPLADGATIIAVDTTQRRFRAGGNAMLLGQTPREHQVLQIDEVLEDSITLITPVDGAWAAGTTLAPTVASRLASEPVLPRFTGDDAYYAISFRGDEPIDVPPDFGGAVYRAFPVFEMPIDWLSDPSYQPVRNLESVDNGVGPVVVYDLAGMVLPRIRFDMTLVDRASAWAFEQLLYALSGRWQPIWIPSMAQDVQIQAKFSDSAIDVAWMGYSDWPIRANRRDLRIEMADGQVHYHRITAAVSVDDDTERLQVSPNLAVGFDAAQVVGISFMALCCQNADVNLLRLWSAGMIESSLEFRGINNDF